MATRTKKAVSLVPPEDRNIDRETLRSFGHRNMKEYAIAVNLDRSVPDLYDGLKPVHRRILWGASQQDNRFIKTMRIAGDVMGKYHPHGDCLDGSTLVYTLDGKLTPIQDMVGRGAKWILAFDKKHNTLVPALAHSWRIGQQANRTFVIQLSDGSSVEATGNHPFHVRRAGWVRTEDLYVGAELSGAALIKEQYLEIRSPGHGLFVVNVVVVEHSEAKPMYDFTVDGFENMLIATNDSAERATLVVAHNSSITAAIETLVNSPTPLMLGSGNWGSLVDAAAAPRYTECKLSAYGRSFFDSDYIHGDVTPFVPNYDDSEQEPVCLPAQLPNVLLNGGDGIGVGITTNIPTFTPESVLTVLRRLIAGERLEPVDYAKTLKFNSKYGGVLVKSKENQKGWLSMFEGPEGRIVFESELAIDRDHKSITIDNWAPGTKIEAFVAKVRSMPECARCYNSKGSSTFTIDCKPAYNYAQFDKFVEKVRTATKQAKSYKLHVTHRVVTINDGKISYETEFLRLSIPKLIIKWMRMRIALELKSLAYRVRKQEQAIAHTKLLIRACDHVDDGVKALKSKDPIKSLMASMKIDEEQAKTLLNLRFIQWSKLDQNQQQAKLKEQQSHLKQLQAWEKNPKTKVALDIEEVAKVIEKDKASKAEKAERKLVIV